MTHSVEKQKWVHEELAKMGIGAYRYCVENDCYVCDRDGNVYAVCKRQRSKAGNLIEKYDVHKLQGSIDKDGYLVYRMTLDGIKKHIKGHRIMLNAWMGRNDNLVVNHKDGDKRNNRLENLEWCTVAENNAHAIETGLFDPYSIPQSYKIPFADWVPIYILHKHCGYSFCELGRMYRTTHTTISAIVNRIGRIMPEGI